MTDLGAAVQPIGTVHTAYTDKAHTPVQSSLNPSDVGRVVLDAPYHDGLDALADFDFAWLLTWLPPDPVDPMPPTMRQVPFLLSGAPRRSGCSRSAVRASRDPIGAAPRPRRPGARGRVRVRRRGHDRRDPTARCEAVRRLARHTSGTALDSPIRSGWLDAADLGQPRTRRRRSAGTTPRTPATLRHRRSIRAMARTKRPEPLLGEWACLGIVYPAPTHGSGRGEVEARGRRRPSVVALAPTHLPGARPAHRAGLPAGPVGEEPGIAGGDRTILAGHRAGRAARSAAGSPRPCRTCVTCAASCC